MTDVLFRALVNAVEYLVPPLHNALKWDPIEFGSIIPVRASLHALHTHGSLESFECCLSD